MPVGGRYRLLEVLGEGGMGNVWLAVDEWLGRQVAIKELVLSPGGEPLEVRRERALREARAAAGIKHSGIVQIHDVVPDDGGPWIVMEYVEGSSLAGRILKGAVPERDLAHIALPIQSALAAVHQAGVVHRDIKPANILICESGRVCLVDFGIAKINGMSGLTQYNALPGTLEFMAPERIKNRDPGPPSDLWSLGVTLYYALEGHSPFRRDGLDSTITAIMSEHPPAFRHPGPLANAIVRLLDKDPNRRLTPAQLTPVLESIINPPPPPPPPPPPTRPEQRPRPPEPRAPKPPPPDQLSGLAPAEAARLIGDKPARAAARGLAPRSPETIQQVVLELERGAAAAIMLELPTNKAAAVLAGMSLKTGAELVTLMAHRPADAALLLTMLSAARAGRLLDFVGRDQAAALLTALVADEAARILTRSNPRTAADIVSALPVSPVGTRLLAAMALDRACAVLNYVPPELTARLLKASTDGRTDRLLDGLSPSAAMGVRRHLKE